MTKEIQAPFPAVDPAGITPGNNDAVPDPPEPRMRPSNGVKEGGASMKTPADSDTTAEGTPNTDLVSVGTNSSSQG